MSTGDHTTSTRSCQPAEFDGPVDYNTYIQSDKWRRFRARYFRLSGRPTECLVCGYSEVQLHHITYANLGNEAYEDVVPLCQEHHSIIHEAHERFGIPLENFEEARRRAMLGFHKSKKKAKARKRKSQPKKQEMHPVQAMHKGTWGLIEKTYRAHKQAVAASEAISKVRPDVPQAERDELARKRRLGVIN